MPPEIAKLLLDIGQAGQAIMQHAADLSPEQYETDVLRRSLVERQCEIIGEALRRLQHKEPRLFAQIPHARRIIDFRNIIAHGYDMLDPVIVSQIVRQHLPQRLQDVQALEHRHRS